MPRAGWENVYGFNMSCIKEMALLEPLVDTVPADSVNSTYFPILSIDILKARVEDLTFTAPFKIRFTRDDYCHALVAYFDTTFSCCHKPVVLSTGKLSA